MASENPSPTMIDLVTISSNTVLTMKKAKVTFLTKENSLMVAKVVKEKKSG